MKQPVVRKAETADARAIAEVQVAGWHATYRGLVPDAMLDAFTLEAREPAWARNLREARPDLRTAVLEREGRIIGFASSGPSRHEPECGEIWAIYVHPEAIGTGAGHALLDDGLAFLARKGFTSTTLLVLEGNARAIRFYERAGFRPEARVDRDGLAHLEMRREIVDSSALQ